MRPELDRRRLWRLPLLSPRQWRRRLGFWLETALVGLVAVGFAWLADAAQGPSCISPKPRRCWCS
ncbi:hypothetical protein [Teichococcus vastitatis]|uniref:Uncharacterized protein n=1 Tax=Teichococcus vastitatis TaxID=2307076 RepID=A0ABS9WC91_9PROT|nr:hypothetical protein [Pseudoroseomonas vastitatis]MCI0756851.1 hypothetical protein [Pseudoroseomonas vastitatis]